MSYLWKFVNRFCKNETKEGIFLASNIACFTALAMIIGIFFCIITGILPLLACITHIILAAIYAGIIFGLFGGIFYLMRHNSR